MADTAKPNADNSLEPLSYATGETTEQTKYHVGTLQYTKAGLFAIFSWMIWGNLCFSLFESAGGPDILKLYLQDNFHVSNLQVNILFNFIPMIIGTVMTPIISFKSDRTRSRLGRRIPYILYTAPFLVLFATALGFSDDIIAWCKTIFIGHSFVSPFTAALIIIGILTVGFSLFNEFVGTVYYYLLPDVMPANFIGRFQAVSMLFGGGASVVINLVIVPYQLTHLKAIHVGVAILYLVGFGLVCWRVKEGQYLPVTDVSKKTSFKDQVRLYFRECFSHPIFILFYMSTAVTMLARGLNPAGIFSLHLNEHQSGIVAQTGSANSVAMTPDGKRTIAGGTDGTAILLDTSILNKPRFLKTFSCQVGIVNCIAITNDSRKAVIGGSNGTIEIWNLISGELVHRFLGHAGGVNGVAIASGGNVFVSGGADKLVAIWDLNTGNHLHSLTGHTDAVDCVAFDSTGNDVVSGGNDKLIITWDAKTGQQLKTLTGNPGPVYTVSFMPSLGKPPASVLSRRAPSRGFQIVTRFLHDVFTNESLYDPLNPPTSAVIAADAWIISGGRDGTTDLENSCVRVWDASTGVLVREMKGHKRAVTSVLYKPDLRVILSGSQDESVRLWMPLDISATADDQSFKTFSGYTHAITSIACAKTGVDMISASRDGKLQLWNIDQGISLAKGGIRGVFFSILGMLLVYPIGAFVDRHNPLRITIISGLLGLPIILAYFFFFHTYTFGLWTDLIRLPLGQLIGVSSVPMLVLLYPKSKYGQFASANALVRQAVGAFAGIVGAVLMDRLTKNSLDTDNYRYGYIFQFVVQSLSVCALIAVYIYWKKLGGNNYVAPESEAQESAEKYVSTTA